MWLLLLITFNKQPVIVLQSQHILLHTVENGHSILYLCAIFGQLYHCFYNQHRILLFYAVQYRSLDPVKPLQHPHTQCSVSFWLWTLEGSAVLNVGPFLKLHSTSVRQVNTSRPLFNERVGTHTPQRSVCLQNNCTWPLRSHLSLLSTQSHTSHWTYLCPRLCAF